MLKISANDAQLTVVACGPITSDRIDLPCEITLSKEFDGLAVTVVFKAGDVQRDVAMLGSPVHVPAECLEQAGEVLMVGIWAGDGSGRPTIPTVWASAGTIRTGALPSGYDPDEPEPDWAAQVQQAAVEAVATANSVRADADAGVFDGEDGYSPSATVTQGDGSATITITDKDGTTTATVHDGADGRDGTDGTDGYSPTATVTQTASGATISITDKSGTTTASVSNGTDGTDGTDGFSPTVDVQAITGGHEVTITDADGAHSFEVMDGDPATPGSITDEMLASDGIKAQVAQLFGNQLTGELSGTIATADDAYAAPPMALVVEGASTQAGTPTPDAPVPILSVDALGLVLHGANLFDVDNADFSNGQYFDNSGIVHNSTYARLTRAYTPVLGDTTYTLSYYKEDTPQVSCGVMFYDSGKAFISGTTFTITAPIGAKSATFTTPANARYIRFHLSLNSSNLQIQYSSTATAYEPYQGTAVPDLLPEGTSLRSLPDGTKDELHLSYLRPSTREGWAWYSRELVQRVYELEVDPTWSFSQSAAGGSSDRFALSRTSKWPECRANVGLFNRFQYSDLNSNVWGYASIRNTNWLVFNNGDQHFSDVTAFKAWLADNPTIILYPLAAPVTTQLDPIELPELPAPNATVWCDGGSAQPTFQMEYVQDANIVIAELRAALADLATS